MFAVASRDHPQSGLMRDVVYAGVPLGRYRYPMSWFVRRFLPRSKARRALKAAAVVPRDDDAVRVLDEAFSTLPEESQEEVRARLIQVIVTFQRTKDIAPVVEFVQSVLITAKLNADPRYQAALREAETESLDQPGVSVEDMIEAANERRRAARRQAS